MSERLQIITADITTLDVDAIVNAANTSLLGGGGVDGAIHAAAGPGLLDECRSLGPIRTGEAVVTGGHDLKARWVVHAVGPIWHGGMHGEPELLAAAYRRSLELARKLPARTLAFPAISCGVFGYPLDEAARTALAEVARFLELSGVPETVTFCCFLPDVRQAFDRALAGLERGGE